MNFSLTEYPFPSQRTAMVAQKGVVASSQYLASQAGLEILKKGGNVVDAAVACAACLTVTEPTSNGIGGDAFALVWFNNRLYGLNSSGPAPRSLQRSLLVNGGMTAIPLYGWTPVTVPGIPAAWKELVDKFGRLPLSQVLQPAINYAEYGYPVSPVVSLNWQNYFNLYQKELKGKVFEEWFRVFAPQGRAPLAGEVWRSPEMARTLALIAETNAESFYRGELAEKICSWSKANDGYLNRDDLENFQPEWVDPLGVNYYGYTVWELPPNGHGIVVLMALQILKQLDIDWRSAGKDTTHYVLEALKLAFEQGFAHIGDPKTTDIPLNHLLSREHARKLSARISKKASLPKKPPSLKGGTVYLAAADQDGNMVSYIQSNYTGFGSGIVVPGTGIALHNRGNCFNLLEGHPNCLEPGKRPYHTIIPGFLTKNSQAIGPFGVMGAMMQPQGHLQVLLNLINFNLNPQAALDAPRWQWIQENTVHVEEKFNKDAVHYLNGLGHQVQISDNTASFGRGQIIWRDEITKIYISGAEPRADSSIACY